MNLYDMLVGDVTRLRYVERFSTCHKVHRENVAEHTFYVAFYAMVLADEINAWLTNAFATADRKAEIDAQTIDVRMLLQRALLHDIEECVTGDINRLFKHSSQPLLNEIEHASDRTVAAIFEKMDIQNGINYWSTWVDCKDSSLEGRLLKFCDYLAVLAYMVQELTHANVTMKMHWKTMWEYHTTFHGAEFEFIRAYVNDAEKILQTAFVGAGI